MDNPAYDSGRAFSTEMSDRQPRRHVRVANPRDLFFPQWGGVPKKEQAALLRWRGVEVANPFPKRAEKREKGRIIPEHLEEYSLKKAVEWSLPKKRSPCMHAFTFSSCTLWSCTTQCYSLRPATGDCVDFFGLSRGSAYDAMTCALVSPSPFNTSGPTHTHTLGNYTRAR